LTWKAARAARNYGAAFDRASDMSILSARLGMILLVAGLNAGFWVLTVMLGCYVFSINSDTTSLTVFGAIVMVVSFAGLAALTLERR
jgi:hypothetical protein